MGGRGVLVYSAEEGPVKANEGSGGVGVFVGGSVVGGICVGNVGGCWGGCVKVSPRGSSVGSPTEKSSEDILVSLTALCGVGHAAFSVATRSSIPVLLGCNDAGSNCRSCLLDFFDLRGGQCGWFLSAGEALIHFD